MGNKADGDEDKGESMLYGSRQRANEMVVTQRAALVGFRIAEGEEFTTSQIAEMCGLTVEGAKKMMEKASAVVPIYDDEDGVWRRVRE